MIALESLQRLQWTRLRLLSNLPDLFFYDANTVKDHLHKVKFLKMSLIMFLKRQRESYLN
jgi:hypothetical protein